MIEEKGTMGKAMRGKERTRKEGRKGEKRNEDQGFECIRSFGLEENISVFYMGIYFHVGVGK